MALLGGSLLGGWLSLVAAPACAQGMHFGGGFSGFHFGGPRFDGPRFDGPGQRDSVAPPPHEPPDFDAPPPVAVGPEADGPPPRPPGPAQREPDGRPPHPPGGQGARNVSASRNCARASRSCSCVRPSR